MPKKVSFKGKTRGGEIINVYGQFVPADENHPEQVRVWTKHQNLGFYNLDRLPGGKLTTKSLETFLTGGN